MAARETAPVRPHGRALKPLYDALGGLKGCLALSQAFYARVARDPVLAPIFPSSFHCAIPAFARFLAQFLGGPVVYSPQRWHLSLREAHLRFRIGPKERDAWMRNMDASLAEAQIGDAARASLHGFFAQAATYLMNDPPASAPPCPHADLAPRWERHLALENAVAAVRGANVEAATAAIENPLIESYFALDRSALIGLLAMMCAGGAEEMIAYVERRLRACPELVGERHVYGRTLLNDAAACGCLRIVQLLLELGADPSGDGAAHSPLYDVGNACTAQSAAAVVRLLANAGADVNSAEGAKRCTPLHMAARRGNVEVATALLECGANREARDSRGVTPLGRALNCRKPEVAELLRNWRGLSSLS